MFEENNKVGIKLGRSVSSSYQTCPSAHQIRHVRQFIRSSTSFSPVEVVVWWWSCWLWLLEIKAGVQTPFNPGIKTKTTLCHDLPGILWCVILHPHQDPTSSLNVLYLRAKFNEISNMQIITVFKSE